MTEPGQGLFLPAVNSNGFKSIYGPPFSQVLGILFRLPQAAATALLLLLGGSPISVASPKFGLFVLSHTCLSVRYQIHVKLLSWSTIIPVLMYISSCYPSLEI